MILDKGITVVEHGWHCHLTTRGSWVYNLKDAFREGQLHSATLIEQSILLLLLIIYYTILYTVKEADFNMLILFSMSSKANILGL